MVGVFDWQKVAYGSAELVFAAGRQICILPWGVWLAGPEDLDRRATS
jgi:hypothetical protein